MSGTRWITLAELEERQLEWRGLAAGSEFSSIFVDPGWILTWWKSYGGDYEPWSLALEDHAGSLRGLAMFAQHTSGLSRTLTFAGGRWNGLETLLFAPGAEDELVAALISALDERRGDWDIWRIGRLPTSCALARALLSGERKPWASAHDLRFQPFLALPAEVDAFESRYGGKRRTEFRRRWRRLLELGAQARLASDPQDARITMARLLELRRSRSIVKGQNQAHMDARFESFITDAACELVPEGARLWSLELDDTILTAKLDFVEGGREHSYMSAVSDELLPLSPGHALERHAIHTMIGEGRTEFDMGPGRDMYKYHWGAVDRELARIVVRSPSPRGRLLGVRAAIDLRLRNTAVAEALRRRQDTIPERATRALPVQVARAKAAPVTRTSK
jgi:CelD/BcsL family acetyltransferase involved in cellulose biosynthesis